MASLRRRRRFPQTGSYTRARQRSPTLLGWLAIVISLALLAVAITTPLWLISFLRYAVPSRYIVAYAPQPIQALVFETNPLQMLPTPLPSNVDPASLALPTPLPTVDLPPSPTLPANGAAMLTPTPAFVPFENGVVTPQPTEASAPNSPTVLLTGFTHTFQGWNNCGPATLAMALSYWGATVGQKDVADFVKPNPEDRNVRPDELVAYANSLGYGGLWRINGSIERLKQLLLAGFPVMVEKGFDPEPDRLGWMGHYLLLIGYSESDRTFITMDSYLGPNKVESFDHVDYYWRHFNRLYLVFYPPERAAEVAAIIGPDMDDQTMYNNALWQATLEKDQNPGDPFAWFNMGSIYVALGDYESAAVAFDMARERGTPWRMLWYQFGPYEAYLHVGGNRLYDVITLANAVLQNNVYSEEAYYYKGLALQAQGEIEAARAQFQKAIQYNSHYIAAYEALQALGG